MQVLHTCFRGYFGIFSEKTSEKTSENIIKAMIENKKITISDLALMLNKSTRAIEMAITKLKSEMKIERIGSDKSGYWKVRKE
jgi:ATP-dependent DNA helicase RecG